MQKKESSELLGKKNKKQLTINTDIGEFKKIQ